MADTTAATTKSDTKDTGTSGVSATPVDTDQSPKDTNKADNNIDDQSKTNKADNKGNKNSKQRKAARWKQMNKNKKDRKRANLGLGPNGDTEYANKKAKPNLHWTKKYDDDKPVTPHEGSFAHIDMQKNFGVSIDLDDTKKKVEEGVTDDDTKVEPGTDDASTTAVETRHPRFQNESWQC